ncbi:hypothetical protein KPL70_021604 [Citrus sinensis]|nr:hypothetical protein KPL70_021604 [Citrus sinensis]
MSTTLRLVSKWKNRGRALRALSVFNLQLFSITDCFNMKISNKTNNFMESGDSCTRLRMSFRSHLGPYHQSEDAFGRKFWRALDAYRRDHGMIGLRVLVRRGQVHPLLVGETGGGVGSEEENLPMDLVSLEVYRLETRSCGLLVQRTVLTVVVLNFRRRENFSFMASTSSSPPVTLSSTLSLPKSCTSHTTNKIENLVEYSYIPESAQISESSYPLLSPYQLYKRPSSFTRSIRTLISTRRPHPKEYIQSSRLDQCALQATSAEQYVTLEIPSELLSNWKREGYTHLHLGGIRLILTLHGRKGLPVTARLAMLDTRFKQYQDAVIAGIRLVYRLQNHALDLPAPEHHSDTLMVLAESDQIPTIIQIPRQIPRHELIKLMPLEWISNYEQFHNNTAPIQTSEGMFERRHDGTVRMTFKPPPSAPQEPPRLSFTYSSMITAVQTAQEDLPITGFNSQGYPVYPAKHNGHFLWDAPGSGMCDPNCPCWDDWEEDDDYATTRKKKPKKKKPPVPCHHYDPKPPSDPPPPPAPLPIYRKELTWIAKHCKSEIPSPISNPTPPLACMMFSSTSSDYSSSFPSLDTHTDSHRNVVSKPFIPSPITSTGHLESPKPFESVLNWQTQNARAQNDTLVNINSKVEKISLRTEQLETKVDSISAQMQQIHQNLQSRIGQLDSELRAMLAHRYNGPEFDQKEREIRRLKAELAQIESEKQGTKPDKK